MGLIIYKMCWPQLNASNPCGMVRYGFA